MKFLHIDNQQQGAKILADKISDFLSQDKKVLWLLSGGTNIVISAEVMKILENNFMEKLPSNLTVTLIDERFGLAGHPDSNWQKLIDAGFNVDYIKSVPVLFGLTLEETTRKFSKNYKELSEWSDVIVGQFGVGVDGHIAGVLPNTKGVTDTEIACDYDGAEFRRVSLTLNTIRKVSIAYTFIFGESKKEMLNTLQSKDLSLAEMPAQILKQIPESFLYSDQI